jgi:hypothetical protein
LLIEWPESFLERSEDAIEVEIGGESALFFDAELRILTFSAEGPIRFRVEIPSKVADYEVRFTENGVVYAGVTAFEAEIKIGRTKRSLTDWFRQEAPAIRFENGAYLEDNEFFELPAGAARRPFSRERIIAWDWTGVDLKKESQHQDKAADSIQRRVLDRLLEKVADPSFDIIFDDDNTGEIADIVCLKVQEGRLVVHLYHCKFSGAEKAGARVDDLYAVCGQAQRSVHWRSGVMELFKHLRYREELRKQKAGKSGTAHVSRFERGDLKTLREIQKQAYLLIPEFRIFIVQPGLSRNAAGNNQLELLGATELYLMDTSGIPLSVIASD